MRLLTGLAIKALFLGLLATIGVAQAAVEPLDRIVAVVNDDIIAETELNQRLELVRQQLLAQNLQLPGEDKLRKQVLERMIIDRLQLQLAARNNIEIDDETLNANLRGVAEQNNMSLEEFRQVLEKEGQSYAALREELRDQLRIRRLRQQMVGSRINVSEQEIDNLLANMAASGNSSREYRLAHILIPAPEAASPQELAQARAKAESVLAQLREGADFARTAVAVSAGQQALEGGDLGWRKQGQLPTLFADVVQDMQPGQISDLIQSASGFHIIKLVDVRGEENHVITQTHVRHILIKPSEMLPASEVQARLTQLRERLEAGEDFATLARSHSEDKVSAARGGDLGWMNPGELVPRFEEAMKQLQPGEISRPVQTQFGWHIIQVLERRQHDSTQEQARAKARELLRQRKGDEELEIWLRRLRDEAYVEYRLEDERDEL